MTREAAVIENDYLDQVNKRLIMLSGVSPEIVDMSQEVEFAQTYITGHMLRAQQAALEQDILCRSTTKFIQSFSLHSQIILQKLLDIIKKYRLVRGSPITKSDVSDATYVQEFISSIETSLPKPDTSKITMQKDNLEAHEGMIDKCIEYYFNDPLFESSEIGEKLGEKLELFKAVWKSSYMRGVLQSNNLVPPQFQMLHGDVDDDNRVDPFLESEMIVKNVTTLALQHEAQISGLKVKADNTMEAIAAKAEGASNGDGDGGDAGGDGDAPVDDNPEPADDGSGETPPAEADAGDGDDLFGDDTGGGDNPLG